jgi:hypothetical protein
VYNCGVKCGPENASCVVYQNPANHDACKWNLLDWWNSQICESPNPSGSTLCATKLTGACTSDQFGTETWSVVSRNGATIEFKGIPVTLETGEEYLGSLTVNLWKCNCNTTATGGTLNTRQTCFTVYP